MENLYKRASLQKFISKTETPSLKNTNIPIHSRCMIVGGTGTGKTNALMNYIERSPKTFQQIVVVSLGIREPLYDALEEKLGKKGSIVFFTTENYPTAQELVDTMEDKEKDQYLVIFDDMVASLGTKKQRNKLENYFIAGRKQNFTLWFLSQDFHPVPTMVRRQLSHLFLLRLNGDKDLKCILNNYTLGVSLSQLIGMYEMATEDPMNLFRIHIGCTDISKKFGRNFLDFFEVHRTGTGYQIYPGSWYGKIASKKRLQNDHSPERKKKKKVVVESDSSESSDSE